MMISTYKKLGVQCLNEHLCFVLSSVVADSFVFYNPAHRKAANHYLYLKNLPNFKKLPIFEHFN